MFTYNIALVIILAAKNSTMFAGTISHYMAWFCMISFGMWQTLDAAKRNYQLARSSQIETDDTDSLWSEKGTRRDFNSYLHASDGLKVQN